MRGKRFVMWLSVTLSMFFIIPNVWAETKLRFATSSRMQARYNLPLWVAEDKDFWKEQGLVVDWIAFRSGTAMARAAVAGSVDAGFQSVDSVMRAVAKGVSWLIVADMKCPDPFYLWVRADSRLRKPEDLKGTKIGLPRFGGSSHAQLMALLRALGLERDVKVLATGGTVATTAALKAGRIDARPSTYSVMARLKYKGEVRELLSLGDYLPLDWFTTVIVSTQEYAQKNPEVVKSVVKVFLKSSSFIRDNPEWSVAKLSSKFKVSKELAKDLYSRTRYGRTGKIDPKVLKGTLKFLMDYGLVKKEKAPSIDKIYTNKFIE